MKGNEGVSFGARDINGSKSVLQVESKYDCSKNVVKWKLIESTETAFLSDKSDSSSVMNEESQNRELNQIWGPCDYYWS